MDTVSTTVIYRLLYFILDYGFTIYECVESLCRNLVTRLLAFRDESPTNQDNKCMKIGRIPKHLTLILGSEEPSPVDLGKLVLWCLSANISFISFYDYKGSLKKTEEELHQAVQARKRASDHVIWHRSPNFAPKNGYVGRKIHVKVLSGDDGRSEVVNLTKRFAESGVTDVNIDRINSGLRKKFEFPDPDLAVCCGKTFSLFGYPPWQVSVTEFLSISSHHNITFDLFVGLMEKYSKCEQRYGK